MTKLQGTLFDDLPAYVGPVSKHPLHGVWCNMKSRCYNPKSGAFKHYGGRGIFVCDEWRNSSRAFVAWAINAGWKPGLQLDRENNDGPYSPGNCRFVTNRENSCNRRDTHRLPDGTPVVHVPRPAGVSADAIRCRIRAGVPPETAVMLPMHGIYLSDGTPLLEAARNAGLKPPTVFGRIRRGWSPDDAATKPAQPFGTRRYLSDGTPLVVACRAAGLSLQAALHRIKCGLSPDQAVSFPAGGKWPASTSAIAQGESEAATLGDEAQRPAIPRGLDLPSADLERPSYDPGYPAAWLAKDKGHA